jgi:hypothetical protein
MTMTWTREQLEEIPEIYRDFMLTLKPILDTRDKVLKINAVHIGETVGRLGMWYQYDDDQYREVLKELEREGLLTIDRHGFMVPTQKGEQLIRALSACEPPLRDLVPPLPKL